MQRRTKYTLFYVPYSGLFVFHGNTGIDPFFMETLLITKHMASFEELLFSNRLFDIETDAKIISSLILS